MKTTGRNLLKVIRTTCAATLIAVFTSCCSWEGDIAFSGPVDGEMLTEYDGIIYKKLSIVINSWSLDEIVPLLDDLKIDPIKSGFIDLMIHEQYFYPFLC